jgi:hypothetical protein
MSLTSVAYPQPNLDTWTLHIYRVHLVEGESLLVDAIVTVVDKFGSQTKLRDPSGHFNPWTVEQSGKIRRRCRTKIEFKCHWELRCTRISFWEIQTICLCNGSRHPA